MKTKNQNKVSNIPAKATQLKDAYDPHTCRQPATK